MSELEFKSSYRRSLPHYQPLGGTFFITGCLSGSPPKSIIDWYKREKQRFEAQSRALPISERAKQELKLPRQWFIRIEGALHKAETGPTWLKVERVAKIVKDAMHFYDGKRYRLDAFLECGEFSPLWSEPTCRLALKNSSVAATSRRRPKL